VDVAYTPPCQRRGERSLGKARPPRGGDGANVDQQPDAGTAKLVQQLVDRLALIADREEPAAQSNSSSRKLFLRLP
jgi:hypothetical protein